MLGALVLVAAVIPGDPRPALVELQMAGRNRDALARVEREIESHPDLAKSIGLSYLRGHLLEALGEERRAGEAFARAIVETPALSAYGRYRLALGQARGGHPEVAAGLLAGIVALDPRSPLVPRAVDLFQANLRAGGDCRLLRGIRLPELPARERRSLSVARARCAARLGEVELARALLAGLLAESTADEWAFEAGLTLAGLETPVLGREALAAGRVLARGREFDLALAMLRRAAVAGPRRDRPDASTAIGEVLLAAGRYPLALAQFEASQREAPTEGARARALADQGRAFERLGRWREAVGRYLAAAQSDPEGGQTAAVLAAALRLETRAGNDAAASGLLDRLASRPAWRAEAARAALFVAASDLVRARLPRARTALASAASAPPIELAYWRGRAAELARNPDEAVASYLAVLRVDPYHPLAEGARRRLADSAIAPAVSSAVDRLIAQGRPSDLVGAWLLSSDAERNTRGLRARLAKALATLPGAAPYLRLARTPVARWPLWSDPGSTPEIRLLALGVWSDVGAAAVAAFPLEQRDLAYTAALEFARVGQIRRSIELAEALGERAPPLLPFSFLPQGLRSLLYPLPYADLLRREGTRRGLDPLLVAAVLREESRFDAGSARGPERGIAGLVAAGQTATAARAGLPAPRTEDLENPEVAIALVAARLGAELVSARGVALRALASFEEGPEDARLWQSYCFGPEPEELWTKIPDGAARQRLAEFSASWLHYREESSRR